MSWIYRRLVRPVLFQQNAETIHDWTMGGLGWVSRHPLLCDACASFLAAPPLPVNVFGLSFPNPVGLAAGMDKHAEAVPAWEALGFGFSELGGVTWLAQPGNPSPRVFRAIPDQAIVNRMGFNNDGAAACAQRLAALRATKHWPSHPVGINLGKSKVTPLEQAAEDYSSSLRVLWPHADFFVVNVSSPNTPNLRQLQDRDALDQILAALQAVNRECAQRPTTPASERRKPVSPAPLTPTSKPKPILVKVAPDLSFDALDEILQLAGPRQVAGIVATNTTITRPQSTNPAVQRVYAEAGGLSGRPLAARSTEVVRHIYRQTKGTLPIMGVGGIFNAEDVWEKITSGASLVQVYTGLVFEGPGIVKTIVRGLCERLSAAGLQQVHQAVGISA